MSRRPQARWLGRLLVLGGLLLIVMLPTAAMAQEDEYPTPSTTVTTTQCEAGDNTEVCGTAVTVPDDPGSLPFTGGNVAMLTVLGIAVAAAGAGLVWVGRRSNSTA
jgi:hypothetical protein